MPEQKHNRCRCWLAVCQLLCSLLLATASCLLFFNGRQFSEPKHFLSLAETIDSYSTVLRTQRDVYLGFYETLPPYRNTVQSLEQLVGNCLPLAGNLHKISELPIFNQFFGSLKDISVSLNNTLVGLKESLQATDNALERYNPEIHQNVLVAIDNTTAELDKLSVLLRQQALFARQTALLLLAVGLLTSLVFALNACFHLASLRQVV